MEAVGVVVAVGPGLTGRKVGDIVAYAGRPLGSYAEEQILPADKVVPVPPSIDPIVAASVMLKGMTAQFLVRRCFKVGRSFAKYRSEFLLSGFCFSSFVCLNSGSVQQSGLKMSRKFKYMV